MCNNFIEMSINYIALCRLSFSDEFSFVWREGIEIKLVKRLSFYFLQVLLKFPLLIAVAFEGS